MTGRLTFSFRDSNANVATTSFLYPLTLSIPQLISRAQLAGTLLQNISNASLFEARFLIDVQLPPPIPAQIQSNSYNRLLVLCRNALRYASFTIPSPFNVVYQATGPHRDYKVDLTDATTLALLTAVVDQLAFTVTPQGDPFPTAEFIAGLMVTD